jgi:tetratricopeptide (TPR) repeat protein
MPFCGVRQKPPIKDDVPFFHNNLGNALMDQGHPEDAVMCYKRAIALKPDYAEAYSNLGTVLTSQDKFDDAVAFYKRAIALKPDYAEAYSNLGLAFHSKGRFDDALAQYGQAIAINPDYAEAHFYRAQIKTFCSGDSDMKALEDLAAASDRIPAGKRPYIHFAFAKALEDTGEYARAFEQMLKGNTLKRRQINYDETGALERFRRIAKVFDAKILDRFQGAGDPSSIPIFVIGMPRSGSTLIEQILASHPQVHGAGELQDLETVLKRARPNSQFDKYPECISSLGADTMQGLGQAYLAHLPRTDKIRIIDKTPNNFANIGLIRMILPNARIIHTMRDPADTCISCFSSLFTFGQGFSYNLEELGRYYRSYSELMVHWRSVLPPGAMLEVSYEDVVHDLEGQARRLIDYCGLPWDDRCLDFHKNKRQVKTASATQVRQPIYRTSLQRWRRYEDYISPLLDELG